MQSQGSTSSQPSSDSLSSSNSLALSDSEQAEDDADLFLTERLRGANGLAPPKERRPDGLESPGSQWAFDGFPSRGEEEEEEERSGGARGRLEAEEGEREKVKSEGDLLFAQKCAELQGFVRPLLALLHGLKTGRFDRGLSSFQQNVAMDRIQRIVGVLQRPNGGEKHLSVLLQVEMMLKQWFPQVLAVAPQPSPPQPSPPPPPPEIAPQGTPGCTAEHRHRDQLHIPVKKRKLSWTGFDPPPTLLKRLLSSDEEGCGGGQDGAGAQTPPPPTANGVSPPRRESPGVSKPEEEDGGEGGTSYNPDGPHPALPSMLPWSMLVYVAPAKPCPSPEGRNGDSEDKELLLVTPPPASRGSDPATQDCSISSTTPPSSTRNQQQQRTRCQNQPVAGQQTEAGTLERPSMEPRES